MKTTGDGFLATFDGPACAIRCAQAIHEFLRAIGVDVRVGLHTGARSTSWTATSEASRFTSARVMAEAGAGETVLCHPR